MKFLWRTFTKKHYNNINCNIKKLQLSEYVKTCLFVYERKRIWKGLMETWNVNGRKSEISQNSKPTFRLHRIDLQVIVILFYSRTPRCEDFFPLKNKIRSIIHTFYIVKRYKINWIILLLKCSREILFHDINIIVY